MNLDRFDQYLAEGRLIRNNWTSTDVQGRHTACWLAAMFDEVAEKESAAACPADQLPQWFAHLIPWMDDNGTEANWLPNAKRLSRSLRMPRTTDQWYRAEYAVRALCVCEAMKHTKNEKILTVCQKVVDLCDVVAAGGERDDKAFAAAAAWAAEEWAAAWATEERAAARAAWAAAWAATAAVDAAAVDAAAVDAAAWAAAGKESADRIIDGVLTVLENQK